MRYDGTPDTASLEPEATQLTGIHPHFSAVGLREMVVTGRKFTDEGGNRSRSYVEYTCRDLITGEGLKGVRRVHMAGGLDDGDDSVLRPAKALRAGVTAPAFGNHTPAHASDGDRVLVGFIEGSRSQAVILGVLSHSAGTHGAKAADGDRRLTLHKNTSVEFKQDGSYNITRKNASGELVTVVITVAGDVEVTGPVTRKYRVNYAGADAVHLGAVTTDHAVLGERMQTTYNNFVSLYNNFIGFFASHTHPTPLGVSGAPLPSGTPPILNPYFAAPVPPIVNPYLGQLYIVDEATITASLLTPLPLPFQPVAPAASPTATMPSSDLSAIVKVQ